MPAPEFTRRDVEGRPNGLILMLHGGRSAGLEPVGDKSTSWRRSAWMMGHIADRAHSAGVSVWLLRYRLAGWNADVSAVPSPVLDARWALEKVRHELGTLPVVLLGHSMGARTAVAVADDPSVTGVVGLAPWLPETEPVQPLNQKHVGLAHGRSDKITSFRATEAFVRRAGSVAATTEFENMGRAGHYMFRRISAWNDFAIGRSLAFVPERAQR
ncbi:MAG TPA: alpha/beta fold hydrolase [Nocardioidaceae bacterium]|nr:alpha/beta fold hydrolase [Nocardioidaceae bacterium]